MLRAGVAVVLVLGAGCDRFLQLQEVPQPPKPDAPPPPSSWASAVGGTLHTCGIREDQTLWCWGRNDRNQLGVDPATTPESDVPIQYGTDTWLAVSARSTHTCAIRSDQTLWCWGSNIYAELGSGTASDNAAPAQIPGTWSAIALGDTFACGLDAGGMMSCWGNNRYGEIGLPVGNGPVGPTARGGGPWHSLTAGSSHGCALDANGQATCWGENGYGEAGVPTSMNPAMPAALPDQFVQITAGDDFTCALRADHTLRCWGDDTRGQLGDGAGQSTHVAVSVDGGSGHWVDVVANGEHACARRDDGSAWCWGDNAHDELVADTTPFAFSGPPVLMAGGAPPWGALALGGRHTCAIDGDHRLWCAGLAGGGQLASAGSHLAPTLVGPSTAVVSAGGGITCAIDSANALKCWGDNGSSSVGDGTRDDRQLPTAVAASRMWSQVSVGDHACAIEMGSQYLYCWGANYYHAVGIGAGPDVTMPMMTTLGTITFTKISASDHTCALTPVGTVYCWGANTYGECGPTGMDPQDPTQVGGGFINLASGYGHTCAPQGAGLECWGYNGNGDLGDGTTSSSASPVMVANVSASIDEVTAGGEHTCARSMNQAWCWGLDLYGQLGDMSTTTQKTPVALAGGPWATLSAGSRHTCGIDTSNRLFCFGRNNSGQLGDGTFRDRHQPTRIGTDADWARVSAGTDHTCAIKLDGALYCWGGNTTGQIGDGTAWRLDLQAVP